MKRAAVILQTIIIFLLLIFADNSFAENTTRRFALIAGANDGGEGKIRLQYAISDAGAVMKVLREIGGVRSEDSYLLVEPDRESYLSGMKRLKEIIENNRSGSRRMEFIFYYSGHSDEEAILLRKGKIYYKEIKDYIAGTHADVRIAILDSCSSGALSRLKGGKKRTSFMADASYDMKGYAYMTSSSLDEASQESDRINGSFFTHYLLSGMRGAADMNQDRRVTLNEAYQYAYSETLAGTEKSMSGPQHPNYNIQMSGTGDVIMTDISKSSSIMIINEEMSGILFLRDKNNSLICELRKPAGKRIQFGLESGVYSIVHIIDGKVFKAEVSLVSGREYKLSKEKFTEQEKELTVNRGGPEKEADYESDDSGEFKEILEKSFLVYPGGLLKLETDRGTVNIKGSNGNAVRIKVNRKIKDFVVKFEKKNNNILVTGYFEGGLFSRIMYYINWHFKDMNYEITVPENYNADIKTLGGSITVDGLDGEVNSKTSGGGLRFSQIRGKITGNTSGGSIELLKCAGNVNLHTLGGRIEVKDLAGDLNSHTTGGHVLIEAVSGNIASDTFGGSITVRGITGSTDVKTSGGSIDARGLKGTLIAETFGGSINAELLNQPDKKCVLSTTGGSVTINLADSIAMDVDAQTSGGRVISDFPVTANDEGEISKSVVKGKINGGGPLLFLRTSGGSIYIERR